MDGFHVSFFYFGDCRCWRLSTGSIPTDQCREKTSCFWAIISTHCPMFFVRSMVSVLSWSVHHGSHCCALRVQLFVVILMVGLQCH